MSQTVDFKAQEDGLAVESVVVGIACDHLVLLGCGENNGVCLLYDITEIESPRLIKTFHLSPASQNKNPENAYLDDLGDLDSETTIFVNADQSPTGKTGILFGGAISGTLSFYEFVCAREEVNPSIPAAAVDDGGGLSGGAIAGIAIAGVVLIAGLVFLIRKSDGSSSEKTVTVSNAENENENMT